MSEQRWTIRVCEKCGNPHQAPGTRSACIVKFDPAGDDVAATYVVEVVPASRLAEVEQETERLRQREHNYLDEQKQLHAAVDLANDSTARAYGQRDEAKKRAERAETERDRAIETRENANAVSVRVEIENRQLRERAERAETALREIGPELANFASYARSVADDSMGMRRKMWQERAAWGERLAALASVPSSLDAPEGDEVLSDPPMGQRPTRGNPARLPVDAPKGQNDG